VNPGVDEVDNLLGALGAGVVVCAEDGRLLYLNSAARDLYGLPENGPALEAEPGSVLAELARTGGTSEHTLLLQDPAGRPRIVRSTGRTVDHDGGRVAVLTLTDETSGRAEAAAAAQQVEAETRQLIDRAPCALLVVDGSGRIAEANVAAATLCGRPQVALVGSWVDDLLLRTDGRSVGPSVIAALPADEPEELLLLSGAEDAKVVAVTAGAAETGRSRVLLIDPRGAAAPSLVRRRQSELDAILRTAPLTTITFDVSGTITAFDGWGALGSQQNGARIGHQMSELHGPEVAVDEAVARALAGQETTLLVERRHRMWDVRFAPMFAPDGQIEGGVAVAADVTQVLARAQQVAVSERRFEVLTERSSDLALIADACGTITFASAACRPMLGYEPSDIIGRDGFEFIHPDDVPDLRAVYERAIREPGSQHQAQFRLRHADGGWRWIDQTFTNLLDDPAIAGIASNLRDITDRRRAATDLARNEARYRMIVESAREGIWMIDDDHRTTYANQRMGEMLGVAPDRMLGRTVLDFCFSEDLPAMEAGLAEGRLEAHRRHEVRLRRADGGELWVMVVSNPVLSDDGEVSGLLGMVTDITTSKADALLLERWALYDDLTGLPNRHQFETELVGLDGGMSILSPAVLMVGIDDMKDINDTAGHDAGDAVIREVGRRLVAEVGADVVARSSGDEFLLLLPHAGTEGAALAATRRVRAALAPLVQVATHEIAVGVSVGVAAPSADVEPVDLLRNAEAALHEAKKQGKGRVVVFDDTIRAAASERVVIEAGLRRAVEEGELEVHYQPVHALVTGQLVGCEALVRWRHPERGLIPPAAFIPLAESSDLINDLGAHVLREACEQAAAWVSSGRAAPGFKISVNVAARQLTEPSFVGLVRDVIATTGIAPDALCLELTESVVMDHADQAATVLRSLRDLGVVLALDDFGTGYSSLSYLRRFTVDILKIDRSFVSGIGQCEEDRAVVDAIIGLAHILGFDVVAEGVETAEQLLALVQAGCDVGQGYYWSPPVPATEFEALLRAGQHSTRAVAPWSRS
jgi:diguanylate cyclase (GGDEF)-like protein/PAS domain S-box-containing protein